MALVPVRGLVYRQADPRHLCIVLATKAGKQIQVAGIVEAFLPPCLAIPNNKFNGQAVHAWWAPWLEGCGPGQHSADYVKVAASLVFKRHLNVGGLAGRLAGCGSIAFRARVLC